jgi:uncharacterized protein (TIGR00369 family)
VDREKRRQELLANFSRAPIKKTIGMTLSYNEKDEAVLEFPHNPGFEHGKGDTHGGIIATMMDTAGWFAAALHYNSYILTIEMQMRFHEPAGREHLRVTGRLLRAGRSFAVAEMEARSSTGRLVATGSGTYAVTGPTYQYQKPAEKGEP